MKHISSALVALLCCPLRVCLLQHSSLGIGYWIDPSGWGWQYVVAAYLCRTGSAILDNLGLLFAVGVAIGMARDRTVPRHCPH